MTELAAAICDDIVNWLRLWLARTWTLAWGGSRGLWLSLKNRDRRWFSWAFMWGRHESPEPCWCDDCGWRGPLRWAFHTYHGCGEDDVEPCDECPRCSSMVFMEPEQKR